MTLFIPTFPFIAASLSGDGTGTLTVNGTVRPIAAPSVDRLRAGVIAFASAEARELNRPVELNATDPDGTSSPLAVHPDGFVQLMSPDRTVPDVSAEERVLMKAPCRSCREIMSVRVNFCEHCFTPTPLSVLTDLA